MPAVLAPYWTRDGITLYQGDALDTLRALPDESVHCCVTSVPYYGLRDYGIDGQIGLEDTPEAWVDALVAVFTDVRRVLREDGTCWVNVGDAYAGSGCGGGGSYEAERPGWSATPTGNGRRRATGGLKRKDLMMLPAMLAIALRSDGWWLRDRIVWWKTNASPESASGRCTRAHEDIYLLTRSARYEFDLEAIAEPSQTPVDAAKRKRVSRSSLGRQVKPSGWANNPASGGRDPRYPERHKDKLRPRGNLTACTGEDVEARFYGDTRRPRNVWPIAVARGGAGSGHLARFPEEVPRRCILAGCPGDGVVLDPFAGSGTTLAVAEALGRRAIGIELNPDYCALAKQRCGAQRRLFVEAS